MQGACFGMGLHCLISGAPAIAFYKHIKKTPVRVHRCRELFWDGIALPNDGLLLLPFMTTLKKLLLLSFIAT